MNYKNLALIFVPALLTFSPSVQAQDSSVEIFSGLNMSGPILTLAGSATEAFIPAPSNSGFDTGLTLAIPVSDNQAPLDGLNLSLEAGWPSITFPTVSSTLNLDNYSGIISLNLTSLQLSEITFNGSSLMIGQAFIGDSSGGQSATITPDVDSPEPSTLAILGLGSALGFFLHRRRQATRI